MKGNDYNKFTRKAAKDAQLPLTLLVFREVSRKRSGKYPESYRFIILYYYLGRYPVYLTGTFRIDYQHQ
jgi:hypothetical protein